MPVDDIQHAEDTHFCSILSVYSLQANGKQVVNLVGPEVTWAADAAAMRNSDDRRRSTLHHKQPALAVDAVGFDAHGRLLLIRRKAAPLKGRCALPGGFVDYGETVEVAVRRKLLEETGLKVNSQRLIGVYSGPKRDLRGHTVSIAFCVSVGNGQPKGGDDAASAGYVSEWRKLKLAFDHDTIVADATRTMKRSRR